VLMTRIATRARAAERSLTRDYLQRVVRAYRLFFAGYSATRVIRVDAERLDLVNSDTDYQSLLAALECLDKVQTLPATPIQI